jgi:phosphoribosylglycinamide formyltransferase-1
MDVRGISQISPIKKRIVFLSGSEVRHAFFASALARLGGIDLALWISPNEPVADISDESLRTGSLLSSHNLARRQFDHLLSMATFTNEINHIMVKPEALSTQDTVDLIEATDFDLIISFGCPLIRPPLVSRFRGSFINIHFGLSPYYRGSATNVWPLINGDFACLGVTYMFLDAGVDTGPIIHQERIRPRLGDTCHTIGLKSLEVAFSGITKLLRVREFSVCPLSFFPQSPRKMVRIADFDNVAASRLYRETYASELLKALDDWDDLQRKFPIFNGCS